MNSIPKVRFFYNYILRKIIYSTIFTMKYIFILNKISHYIICIFFRKIKEKRYFTYSLLNCYRLTKKR